MTASTAYPISIYANGLFQDGYPSPPVAYTTQATQLNAGITTVILWSIHVNASGDLILNDTPFVTNGQVVYRTNPKVGVNPDFPALVKQLMTQPGGTVKDLLVSVGAGGTSSDFTNWQANRATVKTNLGALAAAFGVTGVDFDFEAENNDYTAADQTMIIDLTLDVAAIGLYVTYCPYMAQGFWTGCLQGVYTQNGGQVVRWMNLQCYSGGNGNSPTDWAQAVRSAGGTGVDDPDAFIVPGYAVAGSEWDGQTPARMLATFAGFAGTGVTGGFLWNSGAIWAGEAGGDGLPGDYADAISAGLNG